jgi:NADH-quinone oxidoreductase subunit L
LGSGSVIHAMGGEQDMRKMGGLKARMPQTYWTYVVATLALAGIPFTAGFFSKDLILWQSFSHGAFGIWVIGVVTAGMTAFYMFRQLFMVFHGECRADAHTQAHLHESPAVMTLPLVILAIGSIFTGWLGAPEFLWGSRWDRWLEPVFGAPAEHHGSIGTEVTVTLITFAVVLCGIGLAYLRYGKAKIAAEEAPAGFLYRLSLDKFYVDEFYDAFFVRPFTVISSFFASVIDPWVIDGTVNGVAATVRGFSTIWRGLQTGNVQHYAAMFLVGVLALIAYYLGQL